MTWPPHQMTWHASKQVTSPPWNSRRLVHSKEMVWASRWSVALRTFYRQILSLLYSSFFFWNFRPRLARELLVYDIYVVLLVLDDATNLLRAVLREIPWRWSLLCPARELCPPRERKMFEKINEYLQVPKETQGTYVRTFAIWGLVAPWSERVLEIVGWKCEGEPLAVEITAVNTYGARGI